MNIYAHRTLFNTLYVKKDKVGARFSLPFKQADCPRRWHKALSTITEASLLLEVKGFDEEKV
jgi:hypothetical protein